MVNKSKIVTKLLAVAFVAGLAFSENLASACNKSYITGFASSLVQNGINLVDADTIEALEYSENDDKLLGVSGGAFINGKNYQWSWDNPNKDKAGFEGYGSGDVADTYLYGFSNTAGSGGAVWLSEDSVSIVADFVNNSAKEWGGAIFLGDGIISNLHGNFIGNSAEQGGAIYNESGKINALTGDFIENSALEEFALGGAIYNAGTMTLSGNDFIGNRANGKLNGIYNTGKINIENGKTVNIYDGYSGTDDAQLNIGTGSTLNLNVNNGEIQTDSLGIVTNNGAVNWSLDVDLTGGKSDKITLTSLNGTKSIIINAINLITGTGNSEISVALTDNADLKSAYSLSDDILSHITNYTNVDYTVSAINYDKTTGILTFNKAETQNPIEVILPTGLEEAIEAEQVIYNVSEETETVSGDLGTITSNMVIEGNNHTIQATDGILGIIVKGETSTNSGDGKSLTVQNVIFTNFSTDGIHKGLITVEKGAKLTIKDCVFNALSGENNVAIYNLGTLNSDPSTYHSRLVNVGTATIEGDTYSDITSTGLNGGAVENLGTLIVKSEIDGSNIHKATFTNNKALNGGAIYNSAVLEINGGSFAGNSAQEFGGAIYTTANLTINADTTNGATAFSGNKQAYVNDTNYTENDIYMAGTAGATPLVLTLKAESDTKNITLGSGVDGINYNINVNDGKSGVVSIAGVKNADTILLKGGELDLTANSNANSLTASGGTTLNASSADGLNVGTLIVADGGTFTNSGKLTVTATLTNGSSGTTGTITNTNGILNLLGGTSATAPMTNAGTISGGTVNIGSFTSDTEKDTAYVLNSGNISGEISIAKESTLQTATQTLTSNTAIKNAGTLVFNDSTGGTNSLLQSIEKNGENGGTVEIATTNSTVIDMNGNTITNNIIKLTSGTLKTGSPTGAVDLTGADKIVAGNGTLSVQDGQMGEIKLGDVDLNFGNLNVAIDADFMHDTTENDRGIVGKADVLKATSVDKGSTSNKIIVSNIDLKLGTGEDNKHPVETEFTAKIAEGVAAANADVSNTAISVSEYRSGVGNILLTYSVDSSNNGYLIGKHATLNDAIESEVGKKMYFMDGPTSQYTTVIDGEKLLHGETLAITTNGNNITSGTTGNNGVKLTDDDQIFSIIGTKDDSHTANTTMSGFGTAIDNSIGGKVNLTDITMTGNTTDVINNGEGTKGLFITGISNLGKVAYSGTDAKGQTTIGNGDTTTDTVTIGEIIQKSVNVLSDGTLNISADKLTTTEGTNNAGTLNLSGTSGTATPSALASAIGNTTGTTNITGNIATNGHNITQNNLNVGTTAGKGNLTNNNTINANNIIVTTESILENNSQIAAANGTDSSAITAKAGSSVELNKGSNAKANLTLEGTDDSKSMLAITDSGKLNGNVISDSGSTIELIADTQDITMSNAITGAISGSTAGSNGVYALVAHSVTNTPPTTVYSVTIDKAIAGATSISVDEDTKAAITNVAIGSNTTAPINVSNNAELTLKNITAGTMNVENAITKAGTTDKYDVIVNNTNADGITNINNTISGAKTVTGNGGTTNLKSTVTGADKVIAKAGTTNIDAGTNSNTSSRIGLADIEVKNGATAGVKTTSDNFILDSDVKGESAAATLQLNGKSGTPESPTNVGTQFTIASTINHGTVELANGQLNLPTESTLTNADGLRIDGGATLNTMNGSTSEFNKPTEFKDGAQLKIDADVFAKATDKFINPTELGNEKLTDLSIQGLDKIYNTRSVNLTSETGLNNLQAGAGLADLISSRYPYVVTPVRLLKGQVQQTDEGLILQFVPTAEGYEGFNSAVLGAPIAAQMGGYLTQLHSYDEAFRNMDMYMLMTKEERQAMKMRNKFATASKDLIYDPTTTQYENKAGWFRPYATFENVGLDNGPRVSNVAYGTYVGGDSELYDLGHGWDGMWGAYVGYNGSHQAYGNHNSIYQNGGTLGVVGMAYKGDFFTGLTINAGANGAEASTMYGSENFAMLMAGIASKTGYNWELANGKFIIQPSALVSYSFVNTFDYRNAAGIDISNDPLHAIQIEPGIKLIGNLKNGWQPYASVSMVWNIMDKTHFHANEVALPEMSVKPFVKYGVGVRKSWGERFTAFFQTYFTNGGRNGVGLQAGFRWTLGGNKSSVKTSNNTQVKKEIKSK